MNLPKRKATRLADYDYSQNGAYFITICTHNKEHIFGNVGADSISARMIKDIFIKTIGEYNNIHSPKFVVMPNHFHCILTVERADMESAPTISQIIQAFKRNSTIKYIEMVKQNILPPFKNRIWQRSFYDHIIRNEKDYKEISDYIDTNELKWQNDCFYQKIRVGADSISALM